MTAIFRVPSTSMAKQIARSGPRVRASKTSVRLRRPEPFTDPDNRPAASFPQSEAPAIAERLGLGGKCSGSYWRRCQESGRRQTGKAELLVDPIALTI